MPEYYQTTFVREVVPDADITPLELLLLSRVFHAEHLPAGWHFYAQKSLPCFFYLGRMEIESALAASPSHREHCEWCRLPHNSQ